MPTYALKCRSCFHDFDAVAPMAQRDRIPCPRCGAEKAWTDFGRQGVPAIGNKPWEGVAAESKSLVFQRDGVADIKRDCPSMEFVPDRIDRRNVVATFKNDSHHRQCLKEIGRAKEKYATTSG